MSLTSNYLNALEDIINHHQVDDTLTYTQASHVLLYTTQVARNNYLKSPIQVLQTVYLSRRWGIDND